MTKKKIQDIQDKMISKIIQKEKERQEILRTGPQDETDVDFQEFHKQSLINLKEYLEERLEMWEFANKTVKPIGNSEIIIIKEDIQELNKMIEKYE